jgi:hypothetical protein
MIEAVSSPRPKQPVPVSHALGGVEAVVGPANFHERVTVGVRLAGA